VRLWDVNSKECLHSFPDHTSVVHSVQFHPDGTCVAAGSADRKIKIWDVRSRRLLQHYDAHADAVRQISFHSSGMYMLSASADATLKIWDLRQGHILYSLYGHERAATAAKFSDTGEYFVSGGADNLVMVWKSNIELNEEPDIELARPSTAKKSPEVSASVSRPRTAYKQSEKPEKPKQLVEKSQKSTLQEVDNVKTEGLPQEVKETVDKIVNQMDIITKTLVLLEQRVTKFEDHIMFLSANISGKSKPTEE